MDLFFPNYKCLICGIICEGMPAHGCNNKFADWKKLKPKIIRCKHCKYPRGQHHAVDLLCPAGMKTRIGHLQFGPTTYEPREGK